MCVWYAQLCLALCDRMDYSPASSSIHGILQGRILEWDAISFSRGLPDPGIEPRPPALRADALTSEPPGKPKLGVRSVLEGNMEGELRALPVA